MELRDASDNLIARYEYNGLGHRIAKKTYSGGALAEARNYFYNERWQCLEERVDGSVDRTYVWGERGIDDMVCRERNNERLYPLTDPNGNNVIAIVDVTGDVKERYRYDAFGKVTFLNPDFTTKAASDFDWDYLYTSRQLDKESGLQYSRFRYYHPGLGRFINRDPLNYEAEDVNLYRYVANQAVNADDPLGLDWFVWGRTWGEWWRGTGRPVADATVPIAAEGVVEGARVFAGASGGALGIIITPVQALPAVPLIIERERIIQQRDKYMDDFLEQQERLDRQRRDELERRRNDCPIPSPPPTPSPIPTPPDWPWQPGDGVPIPQPETPHKPFPRAN